MKVKHLFWISCLLLIGFILIGGCRQKEIHHYFPVPKVEEIVYLNQGIDANVRRDLALQNIRSYCGGSYAIIREYDEKVYIKNLTSPSLPYPAYEIEIHRHIEFDCQ